MFDKFGEFDSVEELNRTAEGLKEAAAVKRDSIDARVEKMREIVDNSPFSITLSFCFSLMLFASRSILSSLFCKILQSLL